MSTGTQRRGQVVEYNEYLAKQLQSARQRIKMVDVVGGVTVVGVGLVSYVLTVTVLDQLLTLSTGVRFGLLFLFVLVSLAYIALAIALPASRRVSSLYAAHAVEQSDPNTKNSLLNWLQLQERKKEIPSQIMRAIERRAARDMARIPLQDAIEANHLIRASYVLAGVVVLFCAYTFLTTKPLGPSLKRVLFPLADVAPPTETKLVDIQPGNTEISEGEKLTLSAYASGEQPEVVTAYVKNANAGDEEWEPWTLEAPREEFGPWEVEIVNKHRSFDYYLKANDFASATYRVDVTEAPRVTGYTVTYHYPAYTGQEVFSEEGGNIVALEGTRVEIEASTNLAPKTGVIEVTEYANKKQRKYPMTLSPGSSNRLVGEFVVDADGDYFVDFEDVNGRRPPRKETRQIQAKKDESPILQFIEPAEPESKVPANGAARFRLLASDDYGLDMVAIRMRREGSDEPLREFVYDEDEEKLGLSKQFVEQLDLEPFGLRPGHVIEYWAEAKDNRRPTANASDTRQQEQSLGFEKRRIIITDPVKPQERQEQLEKTQVPPPDGEQTGNQSEQQTEPSPEQAGEPPEQQRDPGDQTDEQFDEKKLSDKDRRKLEKLRELLKDREQKQDKQEQPQQKPDGDQQQNKQEQQEKKSEQKDGSPQQSKSAQTKQDGQTKDGSQQGQQKQTGDGGAQKGDVPQKTTSQQSPPSGDPNKSESSSGASDSSDDPNQDPTNQAPGTSKSEQKSQEEGTAQGGKQEQKEAAEKKNGSDSGDSTSRQDDGSEPMGSDTKSPARTGGQKADSKTDQKPSAKKQSGGSDSKQPKEDGEPQSDRSDAGQDKNSAEQPEKGSSPDAQKKPEDAPDSKMAASKDGKSDAEPKGESKTGQNRQGPSDGAGEKKKGDGRQPTDKSSGGQGEQKESAKPTQKQGNKQVGDPNKSELPADQKGSNPEKSQNPAAGKSDAGDSPPMPDGSTKGEGAPKDQGAAKQQAADQTPRPDGEKDPKQKPSEGARKEGKQDSAANKKGNQDGEANQGDSATKGQSSTGSPSDQKGDNSNSSGQQKGQGQSEGQGDSKQGQSQMGQGKGQGQGKGEEGQGQGKGQQGQGESKADQQGEGKGDSKGEGKAESKSGQSKGSEKGESKGQGGKGDASKGSSGGQQKKPGSSRSSNPTAGGNPGGGGGGSDGITDNSGDDATASDRRQAANLNAALKDASEGRDIDHDLLKELGMTQQEFKEFADRVQQTAEPKDEPIDDPLQSNQRADFGKSSKLRKSTVRGAGKTAQDQNRGMFGGRRGKVPEAYRELFRAYNLSIGRDRGAPAPASPK